MSTCYRCEDGGAIGDPSHIHFGMCLPCDATVSSLREATPRPMHSATHRTCSKCRVEKPNDAFSWRSNGKPFSACKACNKYHYAGKRKAKRKAEVTG